MPGDISRTDPLPLRAVLLDPAHNLSRRGVIDHPDHPDVERIAQTLRASDSMLCHGVGVRPLPEPIARPCDPSRPCCSPAAMKADPDTTHHTCELWYGFRRWVALAKTGRTHLLPARNEVKWLVDDDGTPWTTDACGMANLIENTARGDPTRFDVAVTLHKFVYEQGRTVEAVAASLGEHPSYVLDRLAIIERLPLVCKAAFARNPTKAVERELITIAHRVDPHDTWDPQKRHEVMAQRWADVEAHLLAKETAHKADATASAAQTTVPAGAANSGAPAWLGRKRPKDAPPRAADTPAARTLRAQVDRAREVFDGQTWRPLTPGERAFAQAVLAALARGDGAELFR